MHKYRLKWKTEYFFFLSWSHNGHYPWTGTSSTIRDRTVEAYPESSEALHWKRHESFELISIVGILASSVFLSLPLSRHNPSCKLNAQSQLDVLFGRYIVFFFFLFCFPISVFVQRVMISGTYKEEDRGSRKKMETGHETKRENVD